MSDMSEFQGFSDREITTIQCQGRGRGRGRARPVGPQRPDDFPAGPRRAPPKKSTRGTAVLRQNSSGHPTPHPSGATGLPNEAYFVQQSPTEVEQSLPTTKSKEDTDGNVEGKDNKAVNSDSCGNSDRQSEEITEQNDGRETLAHSNGDTAASLSTLELLQKQQKELEDENRKRKALVEQTLQERYAKSQMEVKTLQMVKVELDRLDSLLNRDVAILRNRIEEANRQYTAARKRYDAAEAEFIAAKLELHRTSESKELLSEHLCTIIQQNEARKAKKLADLLQTLELENSQTDSSLASLPSTSKPTSGPALYQKTPTPGINIWPRERLDSKENSPSRKETGSLAAQDGNSTVNVNTTLESASCTSNVAVGSAQVPNLGSSGNSECVSAPTERGEPRPDESNQSSLEHKPAASFTSSLSTETQPLVGHVEGPGDNSDPPYLEQKSEDHS